MLGLRSQLIFIFAFSVVISAWSQDYVPGQVIVKMRKGSGQAFASGAQAFHNKMSEKGNVLNSFEKMNMKHWQLNPGQDVQAVINEMKSDPTVEYVEPNYILKKLQVDPTDRSLNTQSFSLSDAQAMGGVSAQGSYTQSYAPVKVTEAWSAQTASTLIMPIVAVVDTGVDYNHTVFTSTGAIWTNPGETGTDHWGHSKTSNGIDDDGNGFVDDVRGWNFHDGTNNPMDDDQHGTHCAGIILGVSQDIFATTLSPAVLRIMPLKFLGSDGSGSTSDAINAIYYAVNNGANVISNSWGGSSYSQSLHDALTYAYMHKVAVVAAAGNYGSNNDATAMYPANYPVPSLISVAASNDYDNLASFSNYGKNSVHVSAPGVGIFSTIPGNSFRYMSGTSMATPFVAGMAAMVYREAPNLTGYQVKNIILATVNSLSNLSTKIFTSGRVNEYNAINEAKNETSVQAIQPDYVANAPSGVRAPAAEVKSGCGTVSAIDFAKGQGPQGLGGLAIALAFAMPMVVWQVLRRQRLDPRNRRTHDRFVMNSDIRFRIGDRELSGHMQTISEGGLSFSADQMLERGGVITLMITSPDGAQQIQVQGHIVWSEQNQAYGVKFDEAKNGVTAAIRAWSSNLIRAK